MKLLTAIPASFHPPQATTIVCPPLRVWLAVFFTVFFITGCCSTKQTVTTIERDIPIAIAVPIIQDVIPAEIKDSIITAVKIVNADTVAKITISFPVSDTSKKEYLQKLLHQLHSLSPQPNVQLFVKPDSVKSSVKIKETTIESQKDITLLRYIEITAVGFAASILVILILILLIKR